MTVERFNGETTDAVDLREPETDSWTVVVEQVAELANLIANTDFVPKEYRGSPGQVAATILHGRELGLPPMTALALTNPIKGRPATSAEGMRGLVLQAGHEIEMVEATSSRVVMRGRRRGTGVIGPEREWTTVAWTMDDAKRAGITNGSNWRSYPRQMLIARATAELCRVVFADVIHGLRVAEELADELDQVTEPAAITAAPEPTTKVQRRRKPAKKPEPEPAKPEPSAEPPERQKVELPAPKMDRPVGDPPTLDEQRETLRRLSEERRKLKTEDTEPEPDPEPEITDGRPSGPKITTRQTSALMMHWGRLSMMQDRDERLLATNVLLGYEPDTITSSTELRGAEAAKLLGILERFKDRDQLDQQLAGQDQLTT